MYTLRPLTVHRKRHEAQNWEATLVVYRPLEQAGDAGNGLKPNISAQETRTLKTLDFSIRSWSWYSTNSGFHYPSIYRVASVSISMERGEALEGVIDEAAGY